ncbi:MAG: SDR family oxidoreductase [Bacteroidota bacterium]|nr:SDR family oxidoreductase [Bacteroidota bacterium]
MKTILITGAGTGIGRATVELFSQKGWTVLATVRDPIKYPDLANMSNVRVYQLDVTNNGSIEDAILQIHKDGYAIDVLVNNAGYGTVGALEAASDEVIFRQFNTNVFGLIKMTQAVLPKMRERKAGTIINIASVGGRVTLPLYTLYHGTKWAVEGISESLIYELEQFNIKVRIIEPGPIVTDFYDRSADIFSKPGLTAYDGFINKLTPTMIEAGAKGSKPIVVAEAIYTAATSNSNKIRYPVGGGAPLIMFSRRWFGARFHMFFVKRLLKM